MKKLSIIGKGTAGCFSLTHFLKWTDWEIEWVYDPSIKTQPVGEGSNLLLPAALFDNIGFDPNDLDKIDGTLKLGLKKQNWGTKNQTFYHFFKPGNVGYHFNALKLQSYLAEKLESNPRISFLEKNINSYDSIDSNFILDCSGKPSQFDDYFITDYIPVNHVHVTQCFWDYPRFQYTLTIARPYGWVFGIPLKNRCAIGYLFNSNINSLDEIKEDVKFIFEEYNLTPSEMTNTFGFKNYYRHENFGERISYNGNASFFLEPLEATSIHFMDFCHRHALSVWTNQLNLETANRKYLDYIRETENVIMLHYYAGSPFKTKFWEFAQNRGNLNINSATTNFKFKRLLEIIKGIKRSIDPYEDYGTWNLYSFPINIDGLGLNDRLLNTI